MSLSAISNSSMALNQSSLAQDVDVAITKKILDESNQSSESVIAMMDNLNPNLGKNLDTRA